MWLHCNKCGIQKYENNTVKFFVGLCCHVLCEECNLSKTCPIHKRPFNGIEINESMPHKMRVYFEDPNKLLTSWQKCTRFQSEQSALCEVQEWTTNNERIRKIKEEINVLQTFKAAAIKGIEKDTKCINKMKAYLRNLVQKRQDQSEELFVETRSMNTTTSSLSTSALSLNTSNALGESGVDMDFDDLTSSS